MTAEPKKDRDEPTGDEPVESREKLEGRLRAVREQLDELGRREDLAAAQTDEVRAVQSSLRSVESSLQGDALDVRMRKTILSTLIDLQERVDGLRGPRVSSD